MFGPDANAKVAAMNREREAYRVRGIIHSLGFDFSQPSIKKVRAILDFGEVILRESGHWTDQAE